jgi:hypothetical protein
MTKDKIGDFSEAKTFFDFLFDLNIDATTTSPNKNQILKQDINKNELLYLA